jgi:hypothetical protein
MVFDIQNASNIHYWQLIVCKNTNLVNMLAQNKELLIIYWLETLFAMKGDKTFVAKQYWELGGVVGTVRSASIVQVKQRSVTGRVPKT